MFSGLFRILRAFVWRLERNTGSVRRIGQHLALIICIKPGLFDGFFNALHVFLAVFHVKLGRVCVSRAVWIWIVQKRLDTCQY